MKGNKDCQYCAGTGYAMLYVVPSDMATISSISNEELDRVAKRTRAYQCVPCRVGSEDTNLVVVGVKVDIPRPSSNIPYAEDVSHEGRSTV